MTTLIALLTLVIAFLTPPDQTKGGLAIGEKAPAIVGKDAFGVDLDWNKLLEKGPVVVVFYRGSWCPFCNVYLASLMKEMETISSLGTLIAVTPQKPKNIDQTVKKNNLTFPVVFDEEGKNTLAYRSVSEKHDIPMLKTKQYDSPFLPVPATYIIAQDGTVSKRHYDEDYKTRMSVPELIAEMRRLARKN